MFQNNLLMGAASISAGGFTVDESVRYNDDDSPRLYRTPASTGNRMTGSISLWYKRCNLGSIQQLFNAGAGDDITFNASDKLTFIDGSGVSYITTQLFRDPTAWGHLLFAWDTTLATAGDRLRIYHNGTEITAFDTETNPDLNDELEISNTVRQTVGANESDTEEFDGYLSQFYYVDGSQLTPTSFGEFDSNNVWRPIEFAADNTGVSGTNAVPIMTSNTLPSGTVSASASEYADKEFRAFNRVYSGANYWGNVAQGLPVSLQYQFDSAETIALYSVFPNATYSRYPTGWTFEGSNNGSDWTTLDTVTGATTGGVNTFYRVDTPASYTYYKWVFTASTSALGVEVYGGGMFGTQTGYGNNGFFLDFADSSDFGNDVSGNNNDYTSSGLAADDQVTDTPTNNKCTWSSISHGPTTSAPVLSNGNLDITYPPADCGLAGTMGVIGSGKYYWEYEMTSGTGGTPAQLLGMVSQPYAWAAGRTSLSAGFRSYYTTGVKNTGGTESSYGDSWAVGDRMGVAVDLDNEAMYFAKNNTWQDSGDPTSGASKTGAAFTDITASDVWVPFMHTAGSRFSTVNFNEDDFEYTPPTGYVALATSNLPAPAILDGTANFQTTLYTGDGSVRNIDQTENSTFQPDFVWIKNRSAADSNMQIDVARGVTKEMNSDNFAAQTTDANGLTSFDSDGFGLGTGAGGYNDNLENFVAWQWLAGAGAGSANAVGSITTISTSVNTTAGFSISIWAGTDAEPVTIGHGLGVAPKMIIGKGSGIGNWLVGHDSMGWTKATYWDSTAATYTATYYFGDTNPTSTVFTTGKEGLNLTGQNWVAYCFAEIEGYSRFGSYTGNGSADGTYTYTGFKPAWVMIRKTSGTGNWVIMDSQRSPYNEMDDQLLANTTAAETTGSEEIDFLSNGFKIRTADSDVNTSAGNYIYAAFAEYPFGGDGATPATAF